MSSRKSQQADNLATSLQTTPVAIIGMASVFPKARTTQQYWDNILNKIDCVMEVPPSRWSVEDYYDPNPAVPDKTYCKRGGFIPDVDFDPVEFGLPPNILEVTDVSQLLGLVIAKEAMEDAGYNESREFDREHTGVILGAVGISSKLFTPLMSRLQYPVWEKALLSSGITPEETQVIINKIKKAYVNWEENSFPGTITNVIAGRIANRLDLGGTNCVIDAACASSLAAVRMALMELTSRRSNMMITGGVDTDNSIGTYLCFSKTPAFSKGERVRTFDSASDGMMVGEGIGMFIMKRLEDAEKDGDRIYAVIKGIGSSSDGRFKSIYAPRPAGQAKALARAYEEAGFSPATIGLVEAHGTGTPAGDPAEVESLRLIFAEQGYKPASIALGSVKSQIAHTKAAAGAASVMKVALALHHKVLPPTINVTQPNSKLDLENSPFYLNTETRPWIKAASQPPRRACVSSFGFGGTNYHLVLEEYRSEHQEAYRVSTTPQVVILHAADHDTLVKLCQEKLQNLLGEQAVPAFAELVSSSKAIEIPKANARLGFLAENPVKAAAALKIAADWLADKAGAESWEHPHGIYYRKTGLETKGKVAALFPGQGSQYVNMGKEAAITFPQIRQAFGAMDNLFIQDGLTPLSSYVYPVPGFNPDSEEKQTAELQKTQHAQPAIGTLSAGYYQVLKQAGFEADFFAGHSFGELTALWASGVLDDEAGFKLAKARGKAMAPPADPSFDAGGMLAVKGDIDKLLNLLPQLKGITLANYNSNQQVVLAGAKADIAEAGKQLAAQGYSTVSLPVSAAFHTSLVGHAQKPFAEEIQKLKFHQPRKPVFSNSTGKQHNADPEQIRTSLAGHILNPVLFRDEIENIYAQGGSIFVEIGPKNVLTGLVKSILGERPHFAVALNPNARKDSDIQLREAVVQLLVAGLPLHGFDPYGLPVPQSAPKKKSAATVALNGGYYQTAKSRQAFEDALKSNPVVQKAEPEYAPVLASQPQGKNGNGHKPAQATQAVSRAEYQPQPPVELSNRSVNLPQNNSSAAMDNSSSTLFYQHQKETLRIHEQYLQNQTEYARTFSTLMQSGFSMLGSQAAGANPETAARLLESVERSLAQFHEHQKETLRVHEQYLQTQSALARDLFKAAFNAPASGLFVPQIREPEPVLPNLPARVDPMPSAKTTMPPVTTAPAALKVQAPEPAVVDAAPMTTAAAPVAADAAGLKQALMSIVSEKTGYPVEMIDPTMDMEADLGIDSIKRVEILGAMQAQFPELPKIPSDTLAELRTLEMILSRMDSNHAIGTIQPDAQPQPSAGTSQTVHPVVEPALTPAQPGLDADNLTQALLEIVSEKTGYPQDMLDLDMDMEADLGIDSIKRVEILGAVQSRFPELPKLGADRLAELRTLGQITAALNTAGSVTDRPF